MWAGSRDFWLALASFFWRLAAGGKRSSAERRLSLPKLMLTASTLVLLTSGCGASKSSVTAPPPRPRLESLIATDDGGICMDRQDAAELLLYLDQLERR